MSTTISIRGPIPPIDLFVGPEGARKAVDVATLAAAIGVPKDDLVAWIRFRAADAEPDTFDPAKAPTLTPEVGKAYLCADRIVRWCYARTARGGFYTRHWDGARGAWFRGGTYERGRGRVRVEHLRPVLEVPAPKPGESFTLYGPLGTPHVWTVDAQLAPGKSIMLRKGNDNADR